MKQGVGINFYSGSGQGVTRTVPEGRVTAASRRLQVKVDCALTGRGVDRVGLRGGV